MSDSTKERDMLDALLMKYHNELTTVKSLLNHHRDEATRLQNRMLELQELTSGLGAAMRNIRDDS
jgi:uncharacterized coiled-coil DUF342 family protein